MYDSFGWGGSSGNTGMSFLDDDYITQMGCLG